MGALVQLDGSPFDWLEGRGPAMTLLGAIDDATSTVLALHFRPAEDLHGDTTLLRQVARQYGLPLALYGDRLNVFVRNDRHWTLDEELDGAQQPTHFGRMLRALGIGYLPAGSPQAKGRIERLWRTLQDRLVSERRRRGIATLEDANAFLPEFITDFNRRFAHAPAEAVAAWRPAPRDLERLLSCRYSRVVARDHTVRLGARWLQIPRGPHGRSYAGCRVELRELLDGRLLAFYRGRCSPRSPPQAPSSSSNRAMPLTASAAGASMPPGARSREGGAVSSVWGNIALPNRRPPRPGRWRRAPNDPRPPIPGGNHSHSHDTPVPWTATRHFEA